MRILFYGDSVILASIAASLHREHHFELLRHASPLPGPDELERLHPDVIFFDVENGHPGPAFSLLETRPDLLLLGVSPDGNVVRRWSGRQYRELSTKDLMALIEGAPQSGAVDDERLLAMNDKETG